MVRVIVVVWVLPPPEPVTVMVCIPELAPAPTLICMVDVPGPGGAMDEGAKLTVTSNGIPDADNEMGEV